MRDDAKCEREESFQELFPLIGNEKDQDDLRRVTPDLRHCGLLMRDPSCCLKCNLKENPYKDQDSEAVLEAVQHMSLISEALDLHASWEIGIINREELFDLSPDQFAALEAARYERHIHIAETQANLIAARLAVSLMR